MNNNWETQKKFVLEKIEEHNDEIQGLDKGQRDFTLLIINRINQFELRITERMAKSDERTAKLETSFNIKSGLWGAAAAMIPVGLGILFLIMRSLI